MDLAGQQAALARRRNEYEAEILRANQEQEAQLLRGRKATEEEVARRRTLANQALEASNQDNEARVRHEQQLYNQRLAYLTNLKQQAGVDVSAYLTSGNFPQQKQADKVVQIVGNGETKLHMHDVTKNPMLKKE